MNTVSAEVLWFLPRETDWILFRIISMLSNRISKANVLNNKGNTLSHTAKKSRFQACYIISKDVASFFLFIIVFKVLASF